MVGLRVIYVGVLLEFQIDGVFNTDAVLITRELSELAFFFFFFFVLESDDFMVDDV